MTYDCRIADRVRRVLGGRPDVVEKTLMGSLAFMVNGAMCCSVGRESLLVRVEPEGMEKALALPYAQPMKLGQRTMKGFVRIGPQGVRTDAALASWVERGLVAGARAKQLKRQRRVRK